MNKTAIKNFAIWARNRLIADIKYRAGLMGITENGIANALPQSGSATEFYDIGTAEPYAINGEEIKQRRALVDVIRAKEKDSDYAVAYKYIIEEVAYTWFNRLIAVRFMEVNDYLPSHMRVLSSESGKTEPDIVTNPFDAELNLSRAEEEKIIALKRDNKLDEAFRMLFIKQCNALNDILPALFEKTSDYTELLLNLSVIDQDGVVYHLVHDIPEEDFNVSEGGQVEIIGWMYQYYNTEPKNDAFAKKGKITKEEVPAVTQLFTPDWIVRYMVENSLGRLWVEGHPDADLQGRWKYYLEEAEQEPEVQAELAKIREEYAKLKPEDIKLIDPCMGSGHILVYAFDVFMQIYENAGWSAREAAQSIVEHNIYGLDIDELDETTKKLKELIEIGAIMSQKYEVIVTNPPYAGTSNLSAKINEFVKKTYIQGKADLCTCFMEKCLWMLKPYGKMSMINIPAWLSLVSFEKLRKSIISENQIVNLIHFGRGVFGSDFGSVAFVIGKTKCNEYISTFLKLFKKQGSVDSVEEKEKMFFDNNKLYCNESLFENIAGCPIAYWLTKEFFSTFMNEKIGDRIITREGMATADNDRFLRLWNEVNIDSIGFHIESTEEAVISQKKWFPYNKGGEYRKWYGNQNYIVNWENDGFEVKNNIDSKTGRIRSHNYNGEYAFRSGFTWTSLSISSISVRKSECGFLFDSKGAMGFANDETVVNRTVALLNGKVGAEYLKIFSPTVDFKVGDIIQIPYIEGNDESIQKIVGQTIAISKSDWDSFENSWDFKRHPLLSVIPRNSVLFDDTNDIDLAECYTCWENECNERFNQLKANEEELNRIFIDIYGLQDELTPEVDDKDVTVRKADLQRDIKSLISYAVGCMFGRYSMNEEGLVYAGGEWDDSKYTTFIPDADNIIPITDEEYLEDDIVSRFCTWLKTAFGAKSLETNLDFIAKALGNKGDTSREIIRNYFLNDFFKDHCNTYSVTGSGKRPIYWLFDSGKQNGFKALVYLHRYNADTIGNIRVDYLYRMQRVYESEIGRMQDTIDNSKNSREVSLATKRKEKLQKQLKECREYDEKIGHLALARIELDLDDGVKVNYRKVQTASDGKFYEILADSKNIMTKK